MTTATLLPLPLLAFIGSSDNQKAVAARLVHALASAMTPVPWWQAFRSGETTLGNLISLSRSVHLAIFVVAPDDLRWKSGDPTKESSVVRGNVVFELGLFGGALGSKRSIMFLDAALMPDLPSDLRGVTDVRWNSGEPASFDRAVEKIVSDAKALFSELGLGWWAIRFDNTARPGRSTYGVFEITTQGDRRIARYGNTYYAESTATKGLEHRHRSIWDSQTVAFSTEGEGQARLVVFADVISQAPPDELDEEARKAPRLQTLFELHETDQGELYRDSYFDVQGLSYYGLVVARRLGNCGRDAAMQVAKTEFGGANRP
jgi:hypothetical protein